MLSILFVYGFDGNVSKQLLLQWQKNYFDGGLVDLYFIICFMICLVFKKNAWLESHFWILLLLFVWKFESETWKFSGCKLMVFVCVRCWCCLFPFYFVGNTLVQLLICCCGGTRRFQLVCSVEQLQFGSFLNWLNTTYLL